MSLHPSLWTITPDKGIATITPNVPPESAPPTSVPRSSAGTHFLRIAGGQDIEIPAKAPIITRDVDKIFS